MSRPPAQTAVSAHDDDIAETLLALLRLHPEGMSEHALLHALHAQRVAGFDVLCFDAPLALFRTHFRLFHHLYRLADKLVDQHRAQLHISPLCIRLEHSTSAPIHRPASSAQAPVMPDPLRSYYLDIRHLETTTPDALAAMLHRVRHLDRPRRPVQVRREALQVLGLNEGADRNTIRRRYRRLVQDHHPDRGGDTRRLQAINAAMEVLSEE